MSHIYKTNFMFFNSLEFLSSIWKFLYHLCEVENLTLNLPTKSSKDLKTSKTTTDSDCRFEMNHLFISLSPLSMLPHLDTLVLYVTALYIKQEKVLKLILYNLTHIFLAKNISFMFLTPHANIECFF